MVVRMKLGQGHVRFMRFKGHGISRHRFSTIQPESRKMFFCRLLIFFQNYFFQKILSGISSECQTVWIQIRPDSLSGLIWVQTVCKGYQQTTLVGKKLNIQIILLPFSSKFSATWRLSRGSYMSANVLLNLLNKLGKTDKMWRLPSILLLFHNNFKEFKNTVTWMLDSIYYMTLKLLWKHIFGMKPIRFCHYDRTL